MILGLRGIEVILNFQQLFGQIHPSSPRANNNEMGDMPYIIIPNIMMKLKIKYLCWILILNFRGKRNFSET